MRRISSLPTAEYCSMVDTIGQDVETTQSLRSTIFHEFCDTGVWPGAIERLPIEDYEEIQRWKVPMPFVYRAGDTIHALQYANANREKRVAIDSDFNYVEVPREMPLDQVPASFPQVMAIGHLDMAWALPEYDLLIVCDIKSSIWAVKDRCDSLQLHGYGMAACAATGIKRYLTAIWDATDGRYYVRDAPVEIDSFEAENIRARIKVACGASSGVFTTGTHCSSCWKRSHCPKHLVDVPDSEFTALLNGTAREADVRRALVQLKQKKDLNARIEESIKTWVKQHGPVRSEDGSKLYRCELRGGRDSLDQQAICQALGVKNLDAYKKAGKDFPAFDWRKAE